MVRPVALPCGHAMCTPCRETLVKKRLRTTCPRCRDPSQRPGQDLFERAMIALSRIETRIERGECPSWSDLDLASADDLAQVYPLTCYVIVIVVVINLKV